MFYFPMAGLSSRFTKAGYSKPKYFLNVCGGLNLFQASLKGFSHYFDSEDFCFIHLDQFIKGEVIRAWAAEIGLPAERCHTVGLSTSTKGQADSVRIGILGCGANLKEGVTVFNIDTIYHDFRKAENLGVGANYLDVTSLPGEHWSFVAPNPVRPGVAQRVVEKQRISDLCSVGLYAFSSSQLFLDLYQDQYAAGDPEKEEYVAPMYQGLIDAGETVFYRELPRTRFDFLGTPKEYEDYLASLL